ncbi:unnamed protein product [Parnassius mnemosyne]|uniref:DUF4817 domain-containing protein n=1 Tax=Parnassius mnemosyne TaxID=213953 RepID=A0AAV1L4A3_9NEOP
MSQWTGEQRAFAVESYFKSNDSCTIARRQFCTRFDIQRLSDGPSANLIRTWVQKFQATGSTINNRRPGPSRTSRTKENIQRVESSVLQNPRQSVRKRASSLALLKTTVQRILSKHKKLHPYKVQLVQALKLDNFIARKE